MTQGAENDLADIRFYLESTPVLWNRDNEPFEDLRDNTLVVDNKAILARDTALQAQTDLTTQIGQGGVSEHADATTSVSGFLSAVDKAKLDLIQDKAQLNILAPVDAVELISRKATTLHSHILATPVTDGFISAVDKVKLDGIEALAQVNNISVADATQLTSNGNADALHSHSFAAGNETFTELVHLTTNHAGLPGISNFPGFINDPYNLGPVQVDVGVTVFSNPYSTFTTLDVVSAGMTNFFEKGWWGRREEFLVTNISLSGITGIVTYEVKRGTGGADVEMQCWQGGYGLA